MLPNDNPSLERIGGGNAFRSRPYTDPVQYRAYYDPKTNLVVVDVRTPFQNTDLTFPPAAAELLLQEMVDALAAARSTARGHDVLTALRDTTGGDILIASLERKDAA